MNFSFPSNIYQKLFLLKSFKLTLAIFKWLTFLIEPSGRQTYFILTKYISVMLWPRDIITWSHLSLSNNILLSPHPPTTLSLPTSHLILPSWNIALMRSEPARITSRFLQPSSNSNPYPHLLLGLDISTSKTIQELDYLTKLCDWRRHTKQNQPRIVLVQST